MSASECRDCGKTLGAGYLCDDCDGNEHSHMIQFRCQHCKAPLNTYVENGIVKSDDYSECAGERVGAIAAVRNSGLKPLSDHGDIELVIQS